MAVTYTWAITDMERYSSTGGVFKVNWSCTGTDGDVTQVLFGALDCTPDPASVDFISYESLTEATVLTWLDANNYKTTQETNVANLITEVKTEMDKTSGVPWS